MPTEQAHTPFVEAFGGHGRRELEGQSERRTGGEGLRKSPAFQQEIRIDGSNENETCMGESSSLVSGKQAVDLGNK